MAYRRCGVQPPLEPPAEGADDVYGGPPRCWAGKSGGGRSYCCRSNPTYLPTLPTYLVLNSSESPVAGSLGLKKEVHSVIRRVEEEQ